MNSNRPDAQIVYTQLNRRYLSALFFSGILLLFVVVVVIRLKCNSVSIKTKLEWVEMICDHAIESIFFIIYSGTMISININCWEIVLFNDFLALNCITIYSRCIVLIFHRHQAMTNTLMCELWINFVCTSQADSKHCIPGNQRVFYANSHLYLSSSSIFIYSFFSIPFYLFILSPFTIHIKRIFKSILFVFG